MRAAAAQLPAAPPGAVCAVMATCAAVVPAACLLSLRPCCPLPFACRRLEAPRPLRPCLPWPCRAVDAGGDGSIGATELFRLFEKLGNPVR